MASAPTYQATLEGTSSDKLIGLELARFGAAFAVLVWHYHHFFVIGQSIPAPGPEQQPFHDILAPFYAYGSWSVQLFWCISGFIFAWKYGARIAAGEISLYRFAVLRVSRLWPLQAATLLAVAVSQTIYFGRHGGYFNFPFNDLRHFLLNLVFASRWGMENGLSFNGPAWSISAEIPVYFLFFLGCALIRKQTLMRVPLNVAVLVAAAVVRAKLCPQSAVLVALFFFYLGVLASELYQAIGTWPSTVRALVTAAACLAACVPPALVGLHSMRINTAIVVMAPSVVLALQLIIPDRYDVVNRGAMFLGGLTYASYMLQFPLQLATILVTEAVGLDVQRYAVTPGFFLIWVFAAFALSRLVFRYFEMPAQRALRLLLIDRPVRRGLICPVVASERRPAGPASSRAAGEAISKTKPREFARHSAPRDDSGAPFHS